MSVWDTYQSVINARGGTKRGSVLQREVRMLRSQLPHGLSFHTVDMDGETADVAIGNTDNLNTKYVYSLPGDDIRCGATIGWADNHWLVTERDANNEVYTRAKMLQCNFLLRWIDENGEIHEQWCIIEDGTKYLTGEYEDRHFIVTRGDTRIAMTIARNEHTVKFNRQSRFLIDDSDSEHKLAYALTKPFKLGWVYNNDGVYCFVLQEVNTTDDDDQERGIADYYKYYPRQDTPPSDSPDEGEQRGWI